MTPVPSLRPPGKLALRVMTESTGLATLLATGLATLLAGCVPRADAQACEAMVDHLVELLRDAHEGEAAVLAGEVALEHREELLERCLAEGTAAEVACVRRAESLDELRRCDP